MKPVLFRSFALVVAVMAVLIGTAMAQTGSPVLNTLEVQTLVASSDPADNARLSAHFAALADRYAREATRHNAMAQAFIAAPARRLPANTAADHCKRLATLNTQSAETLRELVVHHEKLAIGATTTLPKGGAVFQSGKGAPEPTAPELRALAANANIPADHHALEEYFLTAAQRYTSDANEHIAMAHAYRGTRISQAAVHCDRLVNLLRDEAKEATAAAEMHRQLANI